MHAIKRITLLFAVALTALAMAPAHAFAAQAELPIVFIVVGFDGGDGGEAVPYDDGFDWGNELFGSGNSLASYYRDMSDGAFAFVPCAETSAYGQDGNTNTADVANDGVIHMTLHAPHGEWGLAAQDEAVARNVGDAMVGIFDAAANCVDFSAYDANGDGTLSNDELAVCVCVAGYDASAFEDPSAKDRPSIWPHAGTLTTEQRGGQHAQAALPTTYIAVAEYLWYDYAPEIPAEQEPLGIVYHELGHLLDLPDLYPVKALEGPWQDYEVGGLSLMAAGAWQYTFGSDDKAYYIPTALDAWSRYVLGWTDPVIVAHSGDFPLSSQLSDAGYSQLIIPTGNPNEYFLVENRQPEGHDEALATEYDMGDGIVVWHIDNAMFDLHYLANTVNDANHHPAIMPEFDDELTLYNGTGDSPGDGKPSGISVSTVSEPGRDMVVHVNVDDTAARRNALHLLNDSARSMLEIQRSPARAISRVLKTWVAISSE